MREFRTWGSFLAVETGGVSLYGVTLSGMVAVALDVAMASIV